VTDRKKHPHPEPIDVEYEDAPLVCEKIEPMFADAADVLDHSADAVKKTMRAAREAGLDVGEAGAQVQEAVARAGRTAGELREAGASVAKAKDAGKRFYKGLERFGDFLIKVRGKRVSFARKF
jgi:hypothetical protein